MCLCLSVSSQRLSQFFPTEAQTLYHNQVLPFLAIHLFPTLLPKIYSHPGGQEEVKESMCCLQTSIEHQDDLLYLSKKWFVCVARDKGSTVDFYLSETISDRSFIHCLPSRYMSIHIKEQRMLILFACFSTDLKILSFLFLPHFKVKSPSGSSFSDLPLLQHNVPEDGHCLQSLGNQCKSYFFSFQSFIFP